MDDDRAEKKSKPAFSILSLLLIVTIVGLGISLYSTNRQLEQALSLETFLKEQSGWIDDSDTSKLYIREMQNMASLARRFLVSFPHGDYEIIAGNWLGGELKPDLRVVLEWMSVDPGSVITDVIQLNSIFEFLR